ncbi:MAG: hypothetical protein QOJ61_4148 [Mycobacterium sp.]|jgi:hypothetical protein|nr:hypothetical protein [Mycobacterium sp.]
MTPQYPYPPVYRPRRHSVVDITITSILAALAGLAALGSLSFSFFFAMATDSCGEQCDYSTLNAAYLVTWGSVDRLGVLRIAASAAEYCDDLPRHMIPPVTEPPHTGRW